LDKSPGKGASSKKTPENTPKTPKTPSILSFAKKVDSNEVRTQMFNSAQKAAQRQKEKKEDELRKKAEAEMKKIEAEKGKKNIKITSQPPTEQEKTKPHSRLTNY